MFIFTNTRFNGTLKDVLTQAELSGSFSITRDGLHFEIFKSDNTIEFKVFDLMSTELLQEWEVKV